MNTRSIILSLSGKYNELENIFFPPIELASNENYVIGLVELLTFNSIPNIQDRNNKLYIENEAPIVIPTGSYEITNIEEYLLKYLDNRDIQFSLRANNNTLQCTIKCDKAIDFRPSDSIAKLLGFEPKLLAAGETHISDRPISISKINSLRVECNISAGAYNNGKKVHTIHEFFPAVPPGFKIIEIPSEIIYLPITTNTISHLQVRIVDQDGQPVNFREEIITIRLHIKKIA